MRKSAALPFGKLLRYGAESAAFFPFMAFFKLIGIDTASALGGFIGRHIFYRLPPADTARQNLRAAYPDMTPAAMEKIVREMCDNLGRVVAEYPHLGELNRRAGRRAHRGHRQGIRRCGRRQRQRRDVHLRTFRQLGDDADHGDACWDIAAASCIARPTTRSSTAGSRVNAPILGPKEQISKGAQGTRRIFTLLRKGHSILMLVDQKTGEGVAAPFFGRDAMTTPAPASLALKLGAILLPASAERIGGAHFRVQIHPPIEFTPERRTRNAMSWR